MTGVPRQVIRTPDQRLRIFVSSTLRELADERRAVRASIETLRLAPVMFELGARPHPPRDLYRSYLDQSDVFLGIYGDSYGWVAPGEQISGLEDEYRLAPASMPKLIYLRESAAREPRLDGLIARIQDDDTASYKTFATTEELAELVQADLVVLLTERFDASRPEAVATPDVVDEQLAPLPVAYGRIIGRDDEIARVVDLLASREHRVVTLLGPGGIGKSRLAIAVAHRAAAEFPGGTVFVPLENVLEPDLLLTTVAYALGVRDASEISIIDRLAIALEGRRMLIVLDNFEQLVDAAPTLVRLYTAAPETVFLVTSRVVLRIRGECVVDVPALAFPEAVAGDALARVTSAPAVELLVDRARAVSPGFSVTPDNAAAVAGICRALDGLPLAIELAAARMRVLTPSAMLQRLDRRLPVLSDAARDLPERQRTLRSTIDWSVDLLPPEARRLLRELSVFAPGFTLESVEAFTQQRAWDVDVMDALETLVDSSLVNQLPQDGQALFSMLTTIREHSVDLLRAECEEDAARAAHAAVYVELSRREGGSLGFADQADAVSRLNLERSNLRAAVRHLVSAGDLETAADLAWSLFLYWWIGGYLAEVALWMQEVLATDAALSPRARAIAMFYPAWGGAWGSPTHELADRFHEASALFAEGGDPLGSAMTTAAAGLAEANSPDPDIAAASRWLTEGTESFRRLGAGWGECLALIARGRIAWLTQGVDAATEIFRTAVDAGARSGDPFTTTIATHHLARMLLFSGDLEQSDALFSAACAESVRLRHDEGIAYGIEGLCAIAAVRGELERAGVLAGAAGAIRRRTAVFDIPAFLYHRAYLDDAVAAGGVGAAEALAAAEARGAGLSATEAARIALDPATTTARA